MDNARRAKLAKVVEELAALSLKIEDIKAEEETAQDLILIVLGSYNRPQDDERYEVSKAAIAAMDNALTSIGETNDQLEEIQWLE